MKGFVVHTTVHRSDETSRAAAHNGRPSSSQDTGGHGRRRLRARGAARGKTSHNQDPPGIKGALAAGFATLTPMRWGPCTPHDVTAQPALHILSSVLTVKQPSCCSEQPGMRIK